MLRSLKALWGYSIETVDGVTGEVEDFYFDDLEWTSRYLVADTGRWLPGRRVLLSPVSFKKPDWERRRFPVNITKQQLENAPDIDTHMPVSRQHELELAQYYNWPPYWMGGYAELPSYGMAGAQLTPEPAQSVRETKTLVQEKVDSHLRSARDVIGYSIRATDGEIGHVVDFILSDVDWRIHYMVVDTRNWLPGRKVLVAPLWVDDVRWNEAEVKVDLTRDNIRHSPSYNPSEPVNEEYEKHLYDYYGRPKI